MKMIDWAKGQCILETKYIPERNCLLEWRQYLDGSPALLVSASNGERLMTATYWQDQFTLEPGFVSVKDWSENEGIYAALVQLGVVLEAEMGIQAGYATGLLCRVTELAKKMPGWPL